MKSKILIVLLLSLCALNVWSLQLKKGHPKRYEVQENDSLWHIASQFLDKPWQWQAVWSKYPELNNPDKIYPRAVIGVVHINGEPALQLVSSGTVHLSPRIRKQQVDNAIPTIPLAMIRPFLSSSQIFDTDRLKDAPVVASNSGEHVVSSAGERVYVTGLQDAKVGNKYTVYRDNGYVTHGNGKFILGYLAQHIADARVVQTGDPATLLVTSMNEAVRVGDKLLPLSTQGFSYYFQPKAPRQPIHGQVVRLFGGLTQVGDNQVVAIDMGRAEGAKVGDVLAIYKRGYVIQDPRDPKKHLNLPNERIGELMVFSTFTHASFALVMRAESAVEHGYLVTNP